MADTLIDLGARKRWAGVVRVVGWPIAIAFGLVCIADLFLGQEDLLVRISAGVMGVFVLSLVLGTVRMRDKRPRWLAVDHEGVRLLNHRRRAVVRIAWGDLSGLGIMTDEAALRRHRSAAKRGDGIPALQSVSVWLEAYPTGPDAVRRHPELTGSWRLGTPGRSGAEQRWLIRLSDGLGQEDLPLVVSEHVVRWRPELWRGHRSGSVLFG